MKAFVLGLSCLFLAISPCRALSLDQLEKGAVAWTLPDGQKWTGAQIQDGPQFLGNLRGFLSGINAAPLLEERTADSTSKIYQPESWMQDPNKAAPSILAFIKRNKPDGFKKGSEGNSATIMMAWYLDSHKDADPYHRAMVKALITDYFQPGKIAADEAARKAENEKIKADNAKKIEEYRARWRAKPSPVDGP